MQEFIGGHLPSTCLSSGLFDPEIEILIRKWFLKALFMDALVLCPPCRRKSREAVLLHIWAVPGMHFPNHLTSRAYLCFERWDLDFSFLVAAVLHKLGSVWSRALWHLPLCFCSCFDSLRGFFRPFLSVCEQPLDSERTPMVEIKWHLFSEPAGAIAASSVLLPALMYP